MGQAAAAENAFHQGGVPMRGKREETRSVRYQGHQVLNSMYAAGRGTSKHEDKRSGRGVDGKIYASSTRDDYIRKWNYFCDSMNKAGYTVDGHKPRTLAEAAGYMPQYIQELQARPGAKPGRRMSAWSVRSYASAAAKAMGVHAKDYVLPERHRADITRSREPAARDKHFSETNNSALTSFATCTGLRSRKELQTIRGTDLISRPDGSYAIAVTGKGGKRRESTVYGSPSEVRAVVDRCRAAGSGTVWSKVHSGADIHACRAGYASRMYAAIARDPKTLPRSERYCCRGDMAGKWYDKRALMKVSKELGHARCNVVVSHYLYQLQQ